jgi:hypothetical protein
MSRGLWFFAGFAASAVKTPPPDSMILLRRIEKLEDESSKRNGKRQIPKKRMNMALQPQISQIHADKKSTTTPALIFHKSLFSTSPFRMCQTIDLQKHFIGFLDRESGGLAGLIRKKQGIISLLSPIWVVELPDIQNNIDISSSSNPLIG